ncbi:hypothetical protein [Luteimonas sp. 3794]|uniref:hypothetical protein n=1 Tax=Luteimonas sp. 3794 TaxID=2817730 RepID=UPI00285B43BC|nr:hypothetical protein [Luteimonas sp. 3794]MDR6991031.1 hypothetical protein [Luteimonas sp. 3794]
MRRRWIAASCIVATGLLIVAFFVKPTDTHTDVGTPTNEVAHNVGDSPQGERWPAIPDGPFDSQRVQLETAAANGNPHAAFRLGNAIAHCLDYNPIASGRAAQMMAELIAQAGTSIRIGGRPLGDERSIDTVLFAQQEARRICADTDSLRASPPTLDAYHYIAQAAEAGHPRAGALYPDVAFLEFRSPIELIDNAEEVDRRRARARAYLLAAVRAGEPEALLAASRAYATDGWLARDPEQALAYWIAYTASDDFTRIPESLATDRTAELEGMLTASQREQAATRAAGLMDVSRERTDAN